SKYKAQIIEVGLKHSLATQYTSFIAVEEKTVIQDGKPVRIEVPVELPEGVSPLAIPETRDRFVTQYYQSTNGALLRMSPASPPASIPGGATQTVEVTADAPNIETTQSQVTHTLSGAPLHSEEGSASGAS